MSNLINIYAYLRNNYSDIDVKFDSKPITYLERILGGSYFDNEKYLFIFKEVSLFLY